MEMPKAFPLVAMSGAHTQHLSAASCQSQCCLEGTHGSPSDTARMVIHVETMCRMPVEPER